MPVADTDIRRYQRGRVDDRSGGLGLGGGGCGASFPRKPRSARMRRDSEKRSRSILSLSNPI
jgi:hypothetical protein